MPFNTKLADRVRTYLAAFPDLQVEEKIMFRGLVFMVNGKMCVNVSGDGLMCRFDPGLQDELSAKSGFQKMIMKGKLIKGYCYVDPEGCKTKKDFEFWVNCCLEFNATAKASKRKNN